MIYPKGAIPAALLASARLVQPALAQPAATGSYHIACGSTGRPCAGLTLQAGAAETHELRCCADSNLGGDWKKHANCPWNVWGASDFAAVCHHDVDFDTGKGICESNGGRLCTKEEVLQDCTRGSGCGHDSDYVWTSSVYASPTSSPTPAPVTPAPTPSPTPGPTPNPTPAPVTPGPTPSPTPGPTPNPTPAPVPVTGQRPCPLSLVKISLLAGNYPGENSWTLKNKCDGTVFHSKQFKTGNALDEAALCLPQAQYEFVITDSWSDGDGNYSVEYEGTEVSLGGAYGYAEITHFGSCPQDTIKIL